MRTLLILLALLSVSCSSSTPSKTTPPPQTVNLTSQPYTLQPGDEKYYCYTQTLTQDLVVTGFTPSYGKGTHHILFAQTLALEPDGYSECHVLFKNTWAPLYVGGANTSPLQLPDGVGMKLPAGTQILLQLHLLNATGAPITDTTGVTMTAAGDPSAPFTPAGIYGIDNRKITVPPNAPGSVSMHCPADKKLDVFALFGHMHQIGKHITLSRNSGEVLYDTDWKFDLQPITPATMTINSGDDLLLKCDYLNTRNDTVTYGESSFNEMCAFVFYYTPFDALDGCVQQ